MKIKYDSNRFIWEFANNQDELESDSSMTIEIVNINMPIKKEQFPKYRYVNKSIVKISSYLDYTVDQNLWRRYLRYLRAELDKGNRSLTKTEATYKDLELIHSPFHQELRYIIDEDRLYIYNNKHKSWNIAEVETVLSAGDGIDIADAKVSIKRDGNSIITTNLGIKLSDAITNKLNTVAYNATKVENSNANGYIIINNKQTDVYTHPDKHTPDIIKQDTNNRFVTDQDKKNWNSKEDEIPFGENNQYFRGDKTWQKLSKSTIGLGSVDNTADLHKPISFPTKSALDKKEPTIEPGAIGQYYRGDKTWQTLDKHAVGLTNVNNTTDLDKPISKATQIALNYKAQLEHGHQIHDIVNLNQILDTKVEKIPGRKLSSNDYTNYDKEKLAGIADNATRVEALSNGQISINDISYDIYKHPDTHPASMIDGLSIVKPSKINGNILLDDKELQIYTEEFSNTIVTEDTLISELTRKSILVDTTKNSITITLPSAQGNRKLIRIKKISKYNKLVIKAKKGQTIDGDAHKTIRFNNTSIVLISNGSNWYLG